MKFRIRYGADVAERETVTQPTVHNLRNDGSLRAELGYGDNVNFLLDGVTLPDSSPVPDGATITVETRCNTKALTKN